MKRKLLSLFVAFVATTALWASNIITYTAKEKLQETAGGSDEAGLHTYAFNVAITSHEFSNGVGTITFAGELTTIGLIAFSGCSDLTSVTVPNSVTEIGLCAFEGCSGLTSITIPNSVTTIGSYAFEFCSCLTSVTIPNSVTTIGTQAFYLVNNIVYNGTATGSPWGAKCVNGYVDGYFVYSDATKTKLCGCSAAATDAITIPNSVTTIGERAFQNCKGLTSITIPNSITTIGDNAFTWCDGLTSITIPNSVTTIGRGAFYECSGLTSITCYVTNPPTCYNTCFSNVDKSIPVYVPAQSVDVYKQAKGWKDFTNILPIGAEEVPTTEKVIAQPSANEVTITWPQTANADTYTIEIKKGSDLVCTLTFNNQGIMTNITFAAPARGGERTSSNAEMTGNGYRFTVTGLEAGTDYTYSITAKSASQQILETYSGEFTTNAPTGIGDLQVQKTKTKFIRNNQLHIFRNGKLYNAMGGVMR